MNRRLPLIAVTAALALAACSKQPDDTATTAAPTETEEVFQESPSPVEPTDAAVDQNATAAVSEIPEPIRGRWGLVAADCTSTRGDAKGLLEVSADRLKFYESVARLDEIKEAGERRIRGTFTYTGEGHSWTQDIVLDVQDDGKTMIRREYGPDAMLGLLKYTRCA